METPVKVAVIYYSATGSVFQPAEAAATEAEKAGARVRLRKVSELTPEKATTGPLRGRGRLVDKIGPSFAEALRRGRHSRLPDSER